MCISTFLTPPERASPSFLFLVDGVAGIGLTFFFFLNVTKLHFSRAQRSRASLGGRGAKCRNLGTPHVYTARPPATFSQSLGAEVLALACRVLGPG